jgi:hypothetical protein
MLGIAQTPYTAMLEFCVRFSFCRFILTRRFYLYLTLSLG